MSEYGIIARKRLDGAMTGLRFCDRTRKLAELSEPGDLVIGNNLSAHKVSGVHKVPAVG